ncbi:MAG: hypothetical protein ACYC06_05880 [Ilumatobacteraceae bacterium]
MAVSSSREHILIERRYASVFATISDESITALATALPEKLRDPLAKVLALPAGTFSESATVATIMRQAMTTRNAHLDTGVLLSEPCTERCIEILGSTSDDPNLADLQANVGELIETFGLDAVRLMSVQYSLALAGFKKLIATDERFALPVTTSSTFRLRPTETDTTAQDEKRRQRAIRKEKERLARAQAQAQRRAARNRV